MNKEMYFVFEDMESGERFAVSCPVATDEKGISKKNSLTMATFEATKEAFEIAKCIGKSYGWDYTVGTIKDDLLLCDVTDSEDILDVWGVDVF